MSYLNSKNNQFAKHTCLTALSFSTVINLSVWANLVLLNTVAIIYTMCGGMKAVIWTDCLQSFVMLFSLAFICIKLWMMLGAMWGMFVAAERWKARPNRAAVGG